MSRLTRARRRSRRHVADAGALTYSVGPDTVVPASSAVAPSQRAGTPPQADALEGSPGETSVNSWAHIDALKAARALPAPDGEWRAFAKMADGSFRFRGRAGDRRIKIERPCHHVPGKWRANGFVHASEFMRFVTDALALGAKTQRMMRGFTLEHAAAVLVALDVWLEAGSPRMIHPTEVK